MDKPKNSEAAVRNAAMAYVTSAYAHKPGGPLETALLKELYGWLPDFSERGPHYLRQMAEIAHACIAASPSSPAKAARLFLERVRDEVDHAAARAKTSAEGGS